MISENTDINKVIDEYIDKYMVLNKCIENTLEYIDICIKEFDNYYYSIEGEYEYSELEKDYIERFIKILYIIKEGLKEKCGK